MSVNESPVVFLIHLEIALGGVFNPFLLLGKYTDYEQFSSHS